MDIYVSPTGSDSNDGSFDHPYQHLFRAVSHASDNDVIYLMDGEYNDEGQVAAIYAAHLTIQSYSNDFSKVIVYIDLGYDYIYDHVDTQLTVKNITFKYQDTLTKSIFLLNNSNSVIYCSYCYFHDISGSPHCYAINPNGANHSETYKCTFRNCYVAINDTSGNQIVKDCIFSNNTIALYHDAGTHDYNCYYNNYQDFHYGSSYSPHEIQTDPKFENATDADIQFSSPCIDAGVTISGYVEDYEGDAPDIGCYENPPADLSVTTKEATNISFYSAQLNGSLDSLGGASSVDVWFEYWKDESGATHYTTSHQTKTETGDYNDTLTELEQNTTYKFRAIGQKNEEGATPVEGEIKSFTTKQLLTVIENETISFSDLDKKLFNNIINDNILLNDDVLIRFTKKVLGEESISFSDQDKEDFELNILENLILSENNKLLLDEKLKDSILFSDDNKEKIDPVDIWIFALPKNNNGGFENDSNQDGVADEWDFDNLDILNCNIITDEDRTTVQKIQFDTNGYIKKSLNLVGKYRVIFEIKPIDSVDFRILDNGNQIYHYKFNSSKNWILFSQDFDFGSNVVFEFYSGYAQIYLDNFAIIDYDIIEDFKYKRKIAPSEFSYTITGDDVVNTIIDRQFNSKGLKRTFVINWNYMDYKERTYFENLVGKKIIVVTSALEIFYCLVAGISNPYKHRKEGLDQTYSLNLFLKEV